MSGIATWAKCSLQPKRPDLLPSATNNEIINLPRTEKKESAEASLKRAVGKSPASSQRFVLWDLPAPAAQLSPPGTLGTVPIGCPVPVPGVGWEFFPGRKREAHILT